MVKTLVFTAPREVGYQTSDDPPLQAGQVRLRTLFSGISAGTELTGYRGTNPYLHKQWDPQRKLFIASDAPSWTYPHHIGYEEVGEVVEIGPEVENIAPGMRVFGAWGHRTHTVMAAEEARQRLMPVNLDSILGVFAQIGAIAVNGVHDGRIRVGETVAVFGLGVLGQIVAQLARLSGATVIGVDLHDARLEMAHKLGAAVTMNPAQENVAELIKDMTEGRGADVCFEVSGATTALHEAIRAAAYSARVVTMGFFQGEAQRLYLGEEFHHNRINIVCSQIFGTDPELTYRWNRLRLAQTAIRLQADGLLDLRPLITHIRPFAEGAELYRLVDTAPDTVLQAVLEFATE